MVAIFFLFSNPISDIILVLRVKALLFGGIIQPFHLFSRAVLNICAKTHVGYYYCNLYSVCPGTMQPSVCCILHCATHITSTVRLRLYTFGNFFLVETGLQNIKKKELRIKTSGRSLKIYIRRLRYRCLKFTRQNSFYSN